METTTTLYFDIWDGCSTLVLYVDGLKEVYGAYNDEDSGILRELSCWWWRQSSVLCFHTYILLVPKWHCIESIANDHDRPRWWRQWPIWRWGSLPITGTKTDYLETPQYICPRFPDLGNFFLKCFFCAKLVNFSHEVETNWPEFFDAWRLLRSPLYARISLPQTRTESLI